MNEKTFEILSKADEYMLRRMSCIFLNKSIEEDFPEVLDIKKNPAIVLHCLPENSRFSKSPLDAQMREEWKEMRSLLRIVNKDRQKLQSLSLELSRLVNKALVPEEDFAVFVSKIQSVHCELLKNALEKEKSRTEELEKKVKANEEVIKRIERKKMGIPTMDSQGKIRRKEKADTGVLGRRSLRILRQNTKIWQPNFQRKSTIFREQSKFDLTANL